MKRTIVGLLAALVSLPAAVAGSGGWQGNHDAAIVKVGDAPVTIVAAVVYDNQSQNATARNWFGPSHLGPTEAGKVGCHLKVVANAEGVVAVEVVWEAIDAFGDVAARDVYRFPYSKALRKGKQATSDGVENRLSDDVATYRVRLSRVKFEDGHIWEAGPQPTGGTSP